MPLDPQKNAIFLRLLSQLKEIDSEFPIQYAICLAKIAQDEGCSLTSLSERTGLALSTISRIVGALSSYRQKGTPYELIEMRVSETERRKKELFLTDKGRQTLTNILSVLE
ncbi:MAG: MarR family transcriptional regulator [Alphaproteobacteria bacterium]|jgi:DNA-binding MarR family transcriptional regulator|nr:MarR family transcriptional regulator [Alphaproteobacteria bacterium]